MTRIPKLATRLLPIGQLFRDLAEPAEAPRSIRFAEGTLRERMSVGLVGSPDQ